MAKFFPEKFPSDADPRDPEYQLFRMLHELPEHFSVIYSKKFKGGKYSKEETEIDFLIFDGYKNLICMEVKGGEIAYSGPDRQWLQNGKEMKKAPDWQTSAATKAVIEYLGTDSVKLNIGWALAFPDCSRPAGSGRIAEVPDDLVLDSQALLDPEKAIARICHYNETHFGREGVNRYQASSILERILRSVGFIKKIGVELLHDSKQLAQATEQKLEILDDLELNPKTTVMGYAGTGKTIIATEFAKRCAKKDQKVMLLFYNRMVANTVRYGLGRESPIECSTFHSLVIEVSSPGWWEEHKGNRSSEFWEMEVPLKMLESLQDTNPVFDTIIIDEGQDFESEWIEALENIFVDAPDSRFVVFNDAKHDIFGRWSDLPWKQQSYTKKQLKKNCRNTEAIVAKLNDISQADMAAYEKSPEGLPSVTKSYNFPAEQLKELQKDLVDLVREGVKPGNIILLIDCPYRESVASKIGSIGRHRITPLGKVYRPDSREIQVTTIDTFKGLESDLIFIILSKKIDKFTPIKNLYTQASRAKLPLYTYELL